MKDIANEAVNEVVVEAVPEVIEKSVKFTFKDAGIIGASVVFGVAAIYGAVTFTKNTIVPVFKKDKTIDITVETETENFEDSEAE